MNPKDLYILHIEDDPWVQKSVATILPRFGIHVTKSFNTVETAMVWLSHDSGIDLVLTDVLLGHDRTDGVDGAQMIKDQYPTMPVIALTGLVDERVIFGSFDRILRKPLNSSLLAKTIREVCGE